MSRRLGREAALQALYQIDIGKNQIIPSLEYVIKDEYDNKLKEFITLLVKGTVENKEKIDDTLQKHIHEWNLKQIASVDRALLRIAVYEMLFVEDIPLSVSINEAIELAKVFGSDESKKFINGVLNAVKSEIEAVAETENKGG